MADRRLHLAGFSLTSLHSLPAYTSRAPSIAGSVAPSTLPPPFSDDRSGVAPAYNTNAAAIFNISDLRPLESDPDVYEFSVGSGSELEDQAWLKWSIFARSSEKFDKPKDPRYIGGDDVACMVALNLRESKHISSMAVVLRGRYITTSMKDVEGEYAFLKRLTTIDITGTRQGDGTIPPGRHEYDVRFPFPTQVNLLDSLAQQTIKGKGPRMAETSQAVLATPQSTQDTQGTLDYDLMLIVEHGKLFKRTAKLRTRVFYIPSIIPDPPSILRQMAYRDCVWGPDPTSDPNGWSTIPSLVIRGDFEGKEEVVKYTVSLANPLSYTRGSFIPVHLEIACENLRLLEALSNRECHDIYLVCEITALLRPEREMLKYSKAIAAQSSNKEGSQSNVRGYVFPLERIAEESKIMSEICFAEDAPVYRQLEKSWPSITLKGEIHLSRSLLPSSDFVPFSVQYKVHVNAPTDANQRFTAAPISGASVPVRIATQFALDVERPFKMLRGHLTSRRRAREALRLREEDPTIVFHRGPELGVGNLTI